MLEKREYMALEQLTEELHQAGYSRISFQIVHTKKRVTGVRAHRTVMREDASDCMYVAEAVRGGKKGRVYWTQMPDRDELLERLEENINALGENCDTLSECEEKKSIKAVKQNFRWEDHEWVSARLEQAAEAAYRTGRMSPARPAAGGESCKAGAGFFLVETLAYEQRLRDIHILREDGTEYMDETGYHCVFAEMMVKKEGKTASARACRYGNSLEEIPLEELARMTAEEAAAGLGGETVDSGRYPVILKNTALAAILEAYLPAFYADRIQNQRSAIAGCRGKQTAEEKLSLREVPNLDGGRVRRMIDDEGNPVKEKYLIRDGIFETELLNQKIAAQLDRECTGNGFKESPQSDVGIGVTNVILESADGIGRGIREMEQIMDRGLLVTEVDGVFAGTDVMTGAFSLIAKGRRVENGKETSAFCQTTIAGNFFDLLRQVQEIGTDHAPTYPDCASVLAPSVYVGELTVSGR